jgi:hypothetical protein
MAAAGDWQCGKLAANVAAAECPVRDGADVQPQAWYGLWQDRAADGTRSSPRASSRRWIPPSAEQDVLTGYPKTRSRHSSSDIFRHCLQVAS